MSELKIKKIKYISGKVKSSKDIAQHAGIGESVMPENPPEVDANIKPEESEINTTSKKKTKKIVSVPLSYPFSTTNLNLMLQLQEQKANNEQIEEIFNGSEDFVQSRDDSKNREMLKGIIKKGIENFTNQFFELNKAISADSTASRSGSLVAVLSEDVNIVLVKPDFSEAINAQAKEYGNAAVELPSDRYLPYPADDPNNYFSIYNKIILDYNKKVLDELKDNADNGGYFPAATYWKKFVNGKDKEGNVVKSYVGVNPFSDFPKSSENEFSAKLDNGNIIYKQGKYKDNGKDIKFKIKFNILHEEKIDPMELTEKEAEDYSKSKIKIKEESEEEKDIDIPKPEATKDIDLYDIDNSYFEKFVNFFQPTYLKSFRLKQDDYLIGRLKESSTAELNMPVIDGKQQPDFIRKLTEDTYRNNLEYLSRMINNANPLISKPDEEIIGNTIAGLYEKSDELVNLSKGYRALLSWYFNDSNSASRDMLSKVDALNYFESEEKAWETIGIGYDSLLSNKLILDGEDSVVKTFVLQVNGCVKRLIKFIDVAYSIFQKKLKELSGDELQNYASACEWIDEDGNLSKMSYDNFYEKIKKWFGVHFDKEYSLTDKVSNFLNINNEGSEDYYENILKPYKMSGNERVPKDATEYADKMKKFLESVDNVRYRSMRSWWKGAPVQNWWRGATAWGPDMKKYAPNPDGYLNYEKDFEVLESSLKDLGSFWSKKHDDLSLEAGLPTNYERAAALSDELDSFVKGELGYQRWEAYSTDELYDRVKLIDFKSLDGKKPDVESIQNALILKKIRRKINLLEKRIEAINNIIAEFASKYEIRSGFFAKIADIFAGKKTYELNTTKQWLVYMVGFKCIYVSIPLCRHDPSVTLVYAPILGVAEIDGNTLDAKKSMSLLLPLLSLLAPIAATFISIEIIDGVQTRRVICYKWVLDKNTTPSDSDFYKGEWVKVADFGAGNWNQSLSIDRLCYKLGGKSSVPTDDVVQKILSAQNSVASMEWTGGFFCGTPLSPFDNSIYDFSGEKNPNEILIKNYKYDKEELKSRSSRAGFLLSTCTRSIKQLRDKNSTIADNFMAYFKDGAEFKSYKLDISYTKDGLKGVDQGDDLDNSKRVTHTFAHPFVITWGRAYSLAQKPGFYDSSYGEPFSVYTQYVASDVVRLEFYIYSETTADDNKTSDDSNNGWTKVYQMAFNEDVNDKFLFDILPKDDETANAIRSYSIFDAMQLKIGSLEYGFGKKWFMYTAVTEKGGEEKDLFDNENSDFKVEDYDDFMQDFLLGNIQRTTDYLNELKDKYKSLSDDFINSLLNGIIDYNSLISLKLNQVIRFYAVYDRIDKYTIKFLEYSSSKLTPVLSQEMLPGSLIVPAGYKLNENRNYRFTGNWVSVDDVDKDIISQTWDNVFEDESIRWNSKDISWTENASSDVLNLLLNTSTSSDSSSKMIDFTNNTRVEKNMTLLPVYDIVYFVTFYIYDFANNVWTTLGGAIEFPFKSKVYFSDGEDGNYSSLTKSTGVDTSSFTGKWAEDIDLKSYETIALNYNKDSSENQFPSSIKIYDLDREKEQFLDSSNNPLLAVRDMNLYALYKNSGITLQYYIYDFNAGKWIQACKSIKLDTETEGWNIIKGLAEGDITASVDSKGVVDGKGYVSHSDLWWVQNSGSYLNVDNTTLPIPDNINDEGRVGLTDSLTYQLPEDFTDGLIKVYKVYKPATVVSFYVYDIVEREEDDEESSEIEYAWKKYIDDVVYTEGEDVVFPDLTTEGSEGALYVKAKNENTSFKYEFLSDRCWADVAKLTDDMTVSLLSAGEEAVTSYKILSGFVTKNYYAQYKEKHAVSFMIYDFEEEKWIPSSDPFYLPEGSTLKDFPGISSVSPGEIDGVDYGFDTNWYSPEPENTDNVNDICLNSGEAEDGTVISPYEDDFEGVSVDAPITFYAVYKPKPSVRFMYYFSAKGVPSGTPGWYQLNEDAVCSVGDTVKGVSKTGQGAGDLTVGFRFKEKWYKTNGELSEEDLLEKFLNYTSNSNPGGFYSQPNVEIIDGDEYTVATGDGKVYLYAIYDPGLKVNYHYFTQIVDGVGSEALHKTEDAIDETYKIIPYNIRNSAGDSIPLGYSFVGWKLLEGDMSSSFLSSLINPESSILSSLRLGDTLLSSIIDMVGMEGQEIHFYASYKKLLSVHVYACALMEDSSLYTISEATVPYNEEFTVPSPVDGSIYFRGTYLGDDRFGTSGIIYESTGIYHMSVVEEDDDDVVHATLKNVMFSTSQQEELDDSQKIDCSAGSQSVTITKDTYFYLLYRTASRIPVSFEYLTYTYNGLLESTGLPDERKLWDNILNLDEEGNIPTFLSGESVVPKDRDGNTLLSVGDDGVGIYANAKYEFTGYWYKLSAEELANDTQLEQIRRRCEINDFEESELVKFDEENKSYLVTEADVESGNEIRFIAVYKRKVTVLFYGYDYTTSTWGTVPNYEAVPAYFFPGEKVMPFPVINSTSASEMNGGEYHGNNYEHSNLWYEYIPSSESSPEFNGYIENGLTADDENVRDPNTDEGVVLPSPDTSGGVVIYYALYTKTIYVKFMVYRFDEEGNLGWQPYSSTVRMKPTLGSLSLIEDLARISEDGLDILVNQSVTDADGVSHDVPDRRYTFKKRWFRYDVESDDADSENNAAYAEADTLLDSNELIAGDSEGSTYFSLDNVWSAHIERNTIFYACYDVDYAFVPRYYIFDVARDEDDKEMAIYSCVNEPVGSDVWDETIYFTQHRDEGSDSDADSVPWCSELDNEDDASWKNFLLETERAADILSMKYATYWHMCADPTNPHKLISTTEVHGGRIEDDEYVKSLTDIKTAFNVNSDGIIEDENVLKNNNLVRFYAEDGSKIPVVLSDKFFDGTEYRHPTTKMRVVSFFATYNRVPAMGVEFMVYDFEEKKWVALKVPGKDGEMKDYAIHSVGDKIYVPNTSTMHSQYYDVAPTYPAVSDDSEEWVDEFDEYDDSGTLISSRVLGKKSPSKYISENSSIYEGNMDAGRNVLFHSRQQWVFGLPEGTPEAEIIHDLCFNNSYYLEDNLNHSIFEGKAAVCTQSVMGNKVTFTRHMSKGEKDGYTDISLKIGDDEVVVEEGKTYRFYALYYIYFNVANIYDTRETPGVPVVARPQNVVDQHPVGSRENNLSRSHMASTVLLRSPLMAASEIKTKLHVYDGVRIRTNYGSPHKFAAVKGLDASTYDPSEYDEVSTYPSFDEYLSYRGEDLYKQEFDFTKIQTSFGKNGKHTLYVWLGEKRRIGTGGDEIWIMVQRMTVQFKNDFEAEGRIDAEY